MDQREHRVKIEAKSLDLALVKAASALGVTQDAVGYEVIREQNGGFLSFLRGGSKVEINAWIKPHDFGRRGNRRGEGRGDGRGEGRGEGRGDGRRHGRNGRRGDGRSDGRGEGRSEGRSEGRGEGRHEARGDRDNRRSRPSHDEERQNAVPAEPLSEEKIAALRVELREFCADICSQIVGENVTVTDELSDGRLVLNLDNDAMTEAVSQNSKLAEALEHILRKKPRHLRQELPFRIFIDANGSRRSREQELIQIAKDLSLKVHEQKSPMVLNYKSSYDRKIIHMALDKDERVYTVSVGSGPNRKLMIVPNNGERWSTEDLMATAEYQDR
jgi:spoIIIJ-associated protein